MQPALIRVRGRGYLAASVVLWLRRLSPRVRIAVDPLPPVVVSPRALCGYLRGGREGTAYAVGFISSVAYPQVAGGGEEGDVEVVVREAVLTEVLREVAEEGAVLPAGVLSVQLALCARGRRLFRVEPGPLPLSDEVAKPLWELLESQGLVGAGPPLSSILLGGQAEVVVRVGASTVSLSVPVFLDESIEQAAALVAHRVLGRAALEPPRLVVLDSGDRVFFEAGAPEGDSSVKLRVGEDGFLRVLYSRDLGRVVGVRGVVNRRLMGGVLDSSLTLLLGQGGLCGKVPALAAAKTSLFAECPVLRGLLSIAARLCL
jgi:hypothetical protein